MCGKHFWSEFILCEHTLSIPAGMASFGQIEPSFSHIYLISLGPVIDLHRPDCEIKHRANAYSHIQREALEIYNRWVSRKKH